MGYEDVSGVCRGAPGAGLPVDGGQNARANVRGQAGHRTWGTEEVQSRMGAYRRKREGGSATSKFRKRRLRPDLEKIPEGSRRREGRDQESSTGLSAARGRRSPSAQHERQSDHRRKLTPPRREGTPRKLPGGNGGRPPAKARRSGGRRTSRSQIWPRTRSSKVGRRITSNLKFYTQ